MQLVHARQEYARIASMLYQTVLYGGAFCHYEAVVKLKRCRRPHVVTGGATVWVCLQGLLRRSKHSVTLTMQGSVT